MKNYTTILAIILLCCITSACKSPAAWGDSPDNELSAVDRDLIEVRGTITPQGITTYQYGTHVLTNDTTFYALKSEKIALDDYLDQEVTILATPIAGYPVDGGPKYLLVLEVD